MNNKGQVWISQQRNNIIIVRYVPITKKLSSVLANKSCYHLSAKNY